MSIVDIATVKWCKGGFSSGAGGNGDCVEVAFAEAAVGVRDSKKPVGGTHVLDGATWAAFAQTVRQ
jgi:hypothetical protein